MQSFTTLLDAKFACLHILQWNLEKLGNEFKVDDFLYDPISKTFLNKSSKQIVHQNSLVDKNSEISKSIANKDSPKEKVEAIRNQYTESNLFCLINGAKCQYKLWVGFDDFILDCFNNNHEQQQQQGIIQFNLKITGTLDFQTSWNKTIHSKVIDTWGKLFIFFFDKIPYGFKYNEICFITNANIGDQQTEMNLNFGKSGCDVIPKPIKLEKNLQDFIEQHLDSLISLDESLLHVFIIPFVCWNDIFSRILMQNKCAISKSFITKICKLKQAIGKIEKEKNDNLKNRILAPLFNGNEIVFYNSLFQTIKSNTCEICPTCLSPINIIQLPGIGEVFLDFTFDFTHQRCLFAKSIK